MKLIIIKDNKEKKPIEIDSIYTNIFSNILYTVKGVTGNKKLKTLEDNDYDSLRIEK